MMVDDGVNGEYDPEAMAKYFNKSDDHLPSDGRESKLEMRKAEPDQVLKVSEVDESQENQDEKPKKQIYKRIAAKINPLNWKLGDRLTKISSDRLRNTHF